MKRKPMKVSQFDRYFKNPRRLSDRQRELLKRDLIELGDLSGIVHDINSNQTIGGNQRSDIFGASKVVVAEQFDPPTRSGTVATGYVEYEGERYAFRQVSWTPEQCEKANIVANKAGGDWDMDILREQFNIEDLIDWGFEEADFETPDSEDGENKELTEDDLNKKSVITFEFEDDVFHDTMQRINNIADKNNFTTKETVLLKILEYYEVDHTYT